MKNIPDELIQRAATGDEAAFEEIYRLASGFVYAVSYRVTGKRHDAQEVTQDVFLKVHANLKKFEKGTYFKAWIYRITVNTAINCYNRNKRRWSREADLEGMVETSGESGDAEKNIEKEEREKRVDEMLTRLGPEQRACLILREIEGLSYEEISAALKVKLNTVRTRIKRARETILGHAARGDKNEVR